MKFTKRRLLACAIALAFAATSVTTFAEQTVAETSPSRMKMVETRSHDKLMNQEDAAKHDEIVQHDLDMRKAAATKAANEPAAAMSSVSDKSQTTKGVMDKDGVSSSKVAQEARQERMNENMDAKQDAVEARNDAREEVLENRAEVKKEKVDAMDSSQPVTDTWITTKVKSELAITDGVSSLEITVDTVDGVVFLTGVVDSSDNATKAAAAAKSVQGVKKVDASGLKSM